LDNRLLKKLRLHILLPLALGISMLFLPLLRDFHFESALIATIVGCFWAAISLSLFNQLESDLMQTLKVLSRIFLIGIPPFIYSLFSGCLTFDGFAFWILLPVPSVFFGASIGRLFRKLSFPKPALFSILVLMLSGVGLWLIEFFTLPQVYFFNHVWGTWPGPIYDETLKVGESLLFFRWITFLWIIVFWVIPDWNTSVQNKIITFLALFCLMLSYLNLNEMNIISPRETLQKELLSHFQTKHFDFFFDKKAFSEEEIKFWTTKHEFYFDQIITELEIDWPQGRKIESYLYANAWQKKKLVGAKFTSYVPIWLEQDQLHIAKQQLSDVLEHELVHAISKQFGNALFNGSWSIGMIEGVAEAIARDASSKSTLDQIIAAESPYPTTEDMKNALSIEGFYDSASSISYTTAGSFVRFLLDQYPKENFKKAYPKNNFKEAYPVGFAELVSEWHDHLKSVSIDSVDQQVSEFIFSRRSLFQKTCPHAFSKEFELWDTYNFHLTNRDSAKALNTINELYELDTSNKLVKRDWLRQQLLHQNYATALYAFDESDSLLTLEILKADALFLNKNFAEARQLLDKIKPRLDTINARNFKYSYELRSDSLQWSFFIHNRYRNHLPEPDEFSKLNLPNLMLIISKSVELGKEEKLFLSSFYSSLAFKEELSDDWFDVYELLIERLIFLEEFDEANVWIQALSKINLRQRYQERLQKLSEWDDFVQQYSLQLEKLN
tara:strand:+ start:1526 stop:3697 length:2172 start_codon:yes stop_codon:yes gene_type:complete